MTKLFPILSLSILILLSVLDLSSKSGIDKGVAQSNNIDALNKQITVDTFSKFPSEIDGCACYYSNNMVEFKEKKYIYVDDYSNIAFVSINGVMTKFEFSKSDTMSEKRSIETFKNDEYEITIDVKKIGQKDETWQQKGVLKIKSKKGDEIIKKIYGECGC